MSSKVIIITCLFIVLSFSLLEASVPSLERDALISLYDATMGGN